MQRFGLSPGYEILPGKPIIREGRGGCFELIIKVAGPHPELAVAFLAARCDSETGPTELVVSRSFQRQALDAYTV